MSLSLLQTYYTSYNTLSVSVFFPFLDFLKESREIQVANRLLQAYQILQGRGIGILQC